MPKSDSEHESVSSGNMEESDFKEFSKIWRYAAGHMQQAINWKGNLRRDYFYYIYFEIKTVLPLVNYNCVL